MTEQDLVKTIAYCGLVCSLCKGACKPDCRGGAGPKDCYQRDCCKKKGFNGCWQCEDFPCQHGFFEEGNEYRGICLGSIQCIKDFGPQKYLDLTVKNLGQVIDYGDYTHLDPEKAKQMLCRDTDT